MVNFHILRGTLEATKADIVAIGCFEAETPKLERADGGISLDRVFGGKLSALIKDEGFLGNQGEIRLLFTAGMIPARYLLLVGLGQKQKLNADALRKIGAAMARRAHEVRATSLSFVLQEGTLRHFSPAKRLQHLVEGILLGAYRFEIYRDKASRKPSSLANVAILTSGNKAALEKGIALGVAIGEATCFARDLVNRPSNDITPTGLVKEAEKMAKREGLRFHLMEKQDLQKEKMGAFLAVSQGAVEPPALIHLSYKPKGKAKATVALVGKAVTFDTGGVSIKPSRNMHEMKSDMAGGAAVIAAMMALARLKPHVAVHGYIPTAENVVDAKSVKPGDIVTTRSGKTVEILNTDAEGRLLLCDTLSYVVDQKPDYIIDLATLTGGALYALGEIYACLIGNDQKLINRLLTASRTSGEYAWQLPLEEQYLKGITKGPADLMNAGGTGAQTIGAALFLHQFVGKAKWAHFDIAACAWSNEENLLSQKGATGSQVATLTSFVLNL